MSSSRTFKYFILSLIVSISIMSSMAVAQEASKIAVVNLDYVVVNSPQGKALQSRIENLQKLASAEIKKRNEDLIKIRERLANGANTLSEDKLLELKKQFEDIQIGIKRYSDDKQREGQKMQAEGLKQIEVSLEPVFKKIKEDRGYDLILNNVPGVVIMASAKTNITQDILDLLNK